MSLDDAFGDPVNGLIELSEVGRRFVQSRGFQRLHRLKQLGLSQHIPRFSCCTHSRFEHSLGVGYAARSIGLALWEAQPELDLRPADIQVLELAGLGHDTGHGPFSHLFELSVLPALGLSGAWHHEQMSLQVVDHIVDKQGLDLEQQQLKQIHDVIRGEQREGQWGPGREFMTQVVSSEGLDVDRLDYFRRDSLAAAVPLRYDYRELFGSARALRGPSSSSRSLCYRGSLKPQAQAFLHDRYDLFDTIYTSAAVRGLEVMVVDLLLAANPQLRLQDKLQSVEEFLTLDDNSLLYSILYHPSSQQDKGLQAAAALIQRLWAGDLYPCCGEVVLPLDQLQQQQRQLPVTAEHLVERQQGGRSSDGGSSGGGGVRFSAGDVFVDDQVHSMKKHGQSPFDSIWLYNEALQPYQPPAESWRTAPDKRKVRVILRRRASSAREQQQLVAAVHAAFCRAVADVFGRGVAVQPHQAAAAAPEAAGAVAGRDAAADGLLAEEADGEQQVTLLLTPPQNKRRRMVRSPNGPAAAAEGALLSSVEEAAPAGAAVANGAPEAGRGWGNGR